MAVHVRASRLEPWAAPHWSDWNWTPRPLIPPKATPRQVPRVQVRSTKTSGQHVVSRLCSSHLSSLPPTPISAPALQPCLRLVLGVHRAGFRCRRRPAGGRTLRRCPRRRLAASSCERAYQRAVVGLSPPHHLPPTYARTAPGTARSLCYGDTTVLPVYASACPFRKKSSAQHEAHIASGFRTPLRVLRAPSTTLSCRPNWTAPLNRSMMEPGGSQTPGGASSDYEFLSPIGE